MSGIFKGLTDSGWVYGWYVGALVKGSVYPQIMDGNFVWHGIKADSLCIFTGKTSKNDRNIYSEDILACYFDGENDGTPDKYTSVERGSVFYDKSSASFFIRFFETKNEVALADIDISKFYYEGNLNEGER